MDSFTLRLRSPLTDDDWNKITDTDFNYTDEVFFRTNFGKEVEFVKVVRCKDCKHYNIFPNKANGICRREEDGYDYMHFYPWDFCSYGELKDE